jgi:hypothetical protein
MRTSIWLALWICCQPLAGCDGRAVEIVVLEDGGSDGDADADADGDSDADTDTGTGTAGDALDGFVTVPPGFDDEPVRLAVDFFHELPPSGLPDVAGGSFWDPAIGPGQPFQLYLNQPAQLWGEYWVAVALFVEGGGTDVPVPGVDWTGHSSVKHAFGPGTGLVQVGQINLQK